MSRSRVWRNVAWSFVLMGGGSLLVTLPVLRASALQVLSYASAITLLLWLRPWSETILEAVIRVFLRWRQPYENASDTTVRRFSRIGMALLDGLQLTFVLMFLAAVSLRLLFLHDSSVLEHLEQAGYTMLRLVLPTGRRDDVPVVVVDTSDVRVVGPDGAKTAYNTVTDRAPLKHFLEELSEHAATLPRVVGIDINFHSEKGGFLRSDDYQFFEFCLGLEEQSRRRVVRDGGHRQGRDVENPFRIKLGVYVTDDLPPERWLAMPDYASLAANIAVPREDQGHLYARLPGNRGPAILGVALAGLLRYNSEDIESWPQARGPFVVFGEHEPPGGSSSNLPARRFLVDYNWLTLLRKHTKKLSAFQSTSDFEQLGGKVVLLGDIEGAKLRDTFVVPGEREPVPGVYLHACAAATLANGPFYELRPFVRNGAELFLVICILAWLSWLRWRIATSGKDIHEAHYPPIFGLVAIAVVVISFLVALYWHVFWPDVLIVAFLLAIHPIVEWVILGFPEVTALVHKLRRRYTRRKELNHDKPMPS